MRRNSLRLAPELSASIVVQGSWADTSKAFVAAMNSGDHNWRAKLNIWLLSNEAFTHMKHTNKLSVRPPSRLLYCHLQLSWGWRRPRTPPRHDQLSPEGLKPESYTWLWPLQCIRGQRCGHLVHEITGPHSHGWATPCSSGRSWFRKETGEIRTRCGASPCVIHMEHVDRRLFPLSHSMSHQCFKKRKPSRSSSDQVGNLLSRVIVISCRLNPYKLEW